MSPSDQNIFRELINFFSGNGYRCVAVLEAYLDESGTHAGAEMLCVAGYVGTRKEWFKFENIWRKKLKDSDIPCFHAKDHNSKLLKLPLAIAIEECKITGFIVSVRPNLFNNHAGEQFKSSIGNAYSSCALGCAMEICKFAKKNKLGSVSVIYEIGQPNANRVRHALELLAKENNPDYKISGVSVAKKDDFLPLQAADFLAHSYSTRDQPWLAYLIRYGKVYYADISVQQLNDISIEIKGMLNHQRNLRRKAKREMKETKS